MSPRSEEFMASAHERVQAAHAALAAGLPAPAVSAAYYAALYAADARRISGEQAESVVSDAERFIAAVVALLKD